MCCVLSHFSRVWLFATLWTVARQTPLSMGFCRQEYWSGLPCPSPVDLPNPGMEPMSLTSPSLAGGFFITTATWEALKIYRPSLINKKEARKEGRDEGRQECIEAFMKIQMNWVQRASRLVSKWRFGESSMPWGHGSLCSFSITCPAHHFHLATPLSYSFIINL